MTAAEFIRDVARITFGYPLKDWCAFAEARMSECGANVVVTVGFSKSPHRDTGEPSTSANRNVRPTWMIEARGPTPPMHIVYEMVRELVLHELQESVLWDGERIMDPHKEQGPG